MTKPISALNALINSQATPISTENHNPFRNSHYMVWWYRTSLIDVLFQITEGFTFTFFSIFCDITKSSTSYEIL